MTATAAATDEVTVGIAEYAVVTGSAAITTSGLGSCVGVAVYDRTGEAAGLAHVMVPEADGADGPPAKFADAGTAALIEALTAAGGTELRAKLAGGSDMLGLSEGATIGERNAAQVREVLADHDVPVVAADIGGESGRSLQFETVSGTLLVRTADGRTHQL